MILLRAVTQAADSGLALTNRASQAPLSRHPTFTQQLPAPAPTPAITPPPRRGDLPTELYSHRLPCKPSLIARRCGPRHATHDRRDEGCNVFRRNRPGIGDSVR